MAIEKVGSIYIEFPDPRPMKKNGAKYLRELVLWLNDRPETLNDNKSHLDLIVEFNLYRKSLKK